MGSIGKCCCDDGECIPCEEQSGLCSWSITSPVLDFEFAGPFGELIDTGFNCTKCGTECKREDNIFLGETSAASDWSAWSSPILRCGPCYDCSDLDNPEELTPCTVDVEGNITCPGDYPQYTVAQFAERNGFRLRFWFSKMARARVCVEYPTATTVRFRVDIDWKVNITDTVSYAIQRRYRIEKRQCSSNLVITSTVYNDGTINIPTPIAPCFDILDAFAETPGLDSSTCPAWYGFPEPDPCEASTVTTVSLPDDPCIISQNTTDLPCLVVSGSTTLTTESSRTCCDVGFLCGAPAFTGRAGASTYYSEAYDCTEVPAEILLTRAFSTGGTSFELEFECDDGVDTPYSVPIVIPETLTMAVSGDCP
jgi:hypothetical protein